jgi:hypothetical protein
MRIGIVNDLHLGHRGEGRWHNRLLYDRAEEIARSAIAVLNRQSLDLVLVPGDITEAGTEAQLLLARDILGAIEAPWYALPGNHDRAAVRSGQFDGVFAGHLPDLYSRRDDVGLLSLREKLPADGMRAAGYRIGDAVIEQAVARVADDRPPVLLVASHVPLVTEEAHAGGHGGKYAGHYADGLDLLARLESLAPRRSFIFCAHQHWHHILESPHWVQCTNAAMIEYPMEIRVVSVESAAMRISTVAAASREIAARSLDQARWVAGEKRDRDYVQS